MGYVQPQKNLTAEWLPGGGAVLILRYRGRDWKRRLSPNDLVTVIEAAALLNVSRTALYQWIEQGRIQCSRSPSPKGHAKKVFRLSDLRQFGLEHDFL